MDARLEQSDPVYDDPKNLTNKRIKIILDLAHIGLNKKALNVYGNTFERPAEAQEAIDALDALTTKLHSNKAANKRVKSYRQKKQAAIACSQCHSTVGANGSDLCSECKETI